MGGWVGGWVGKRSNHHHHHHPSYQERERRQRQWSLAWCVLFVHHHDLRSKVPPSAQPVDPLAPSNMNPDTRNTVRQQNLDGGRIGPIADAQRAASHALRPSGKGILRGDALHAEALRRARTRRSFPRSLEEEEEASVDPAAATEAATAAAAAVAAGSDGHLGDPIGSMAQGVSGVLVWAALDADVGALCNVVKKTAGMPLWGVDPLCWEPEARTSAPPTTGPPFLVQGASTRPADAPGSLVVVRLRDEKAQRMAGAAHPLGWGEGEEEEEEGGGEIRVAVDRTTGIAYMLWTHAAQFLGVHWSVLRWMARAAIVRCFVRVEPRAMWATGRLAVQLAEALRTDPGGWGDGELVPRARDYATGEDACTPIALPLLACCTRMLSMLRANLGGAADATAK